MTSEAILGLPILDLIVEAGWKSAIVAGLALVLLAAFRRRSAAERACVAHVGMVALLLLPLLVVAGPSLEVLPARDVAAAPAVMPSAATAAIIGEDVPSPRAELPVSPGMSGEQVTALAYGLPAALLLLLTLVAIGRLFALRGRANVIVQPGWLSALAHAQRRMGIKSGTALLVSQELTSPVSWGVMRPIILLNEAALDSADDAEAIIAHELAHVAHLDWLNLLAARIATALFWFNPLVWLLARRGHQLREEAADDAVLRAQVPSTDYAALLVGTARHEGNQMLLAAHGVAPSKGSLAMRVHRILQPALPRTPARLAWASGSAVLMVAIAAPLAALSPARAPLATAAPVAPIAALAPTAPPAPVAPIAPLAPPAPAAAAVAVVPPAPAPQLPAATPAPPAVAVAASGVTVTVDQAGTRVDVGSGLSPEALVALRVHGVRADDVRAYTAAYPRLRGVSAEQLVGLRVHGIGPERLRDYAALGYPNLSYDRIVEWGVHGVTPAFIRSVNNAGYRQLNPARLTEFRIHGVTGEFIQQVHNAGIREVTAERLVEMRILGSGPPTPPRTPPRPRPQR